MIRLTAAGRNGEDEGPGPPDPPQQTPDAPVKEPPDGPQNEPPAPVHEPGPDPQKRFV
jgi:hypothetical protein